MFYPNTSISIYRDTDDPEQVHRGPRTAAPAIATGVTASIIAQTVGYPANSDRDYPVNSITGRVDISVDVRAGDEIKDETTGKRYSVQGVITNRTFVANTKRLVLKAAD